MTPSPDRSHRVVDVHESVLGHNDEQARRNRALFGEKHIQTINVLSSPGSGKTTFLQRTLADLRGTLRGAVVVGDLATDNDARRLSESGAPVVQITTGTICHLEAQMVYQAMQELDLDNLDLLIIENVGNLVCPAAYDLGEDFRVALLSVTEGEDKPLKYPTMFKTAEVIVVNKMDIAEVVGFDRESALENIHAIAPGAAVFEVSARTGTGMEAWYGYLTHRMEERGKR